MKMSHVSLCLALLAAVLFAGPALADDAATAPLFLDAPQACAGGAEAPAVTEMDLYQVFQGAQFDGATEARQIIGGGQCNQAVCGQGQFCCNYSCSVCAPIGGACLDVYCPPIS